MSIIYKMDHTDEDAVTLLLTMIDRKVAQYDEYYRHCSKQVETKSAIAIKLPQGIDQLDDIMLDDIHIGAHTIRIFDRFIIMDYNVIECDLVKGDIYVYNFDQCHDVVQEAMDSVQAIVEDAMFIGLYNEWDATKALDMVSLLHKVLLEFEEYSDVTLQEVDDMLEWIGYNRINKELH